MTTFICCCFQTEPILTYISKINMKLTHCDKTVIISINVNLDKKHLEQYIMCNIGSKCLKISIYFTCYAFLHVNVSCKLITFTNIEIRVFRFCCGFEISQN